MTSNDILLCWVRFVFAIGKHLDYFEYFNETFSHESGKKVNLNDKLLLESMEINPYRYVVLIDIQKHGLEASTLSKHLKRGSQKQLESKL